MSTTKQAATQALAGEYGRKLADSLTRQLVAAVDGFPTDDPAKKTAILQLIADGLAVELQERA